MTYLTDKKPFNFNIEALRGVVALMVVWHHPITHKNFLDPFYNSTGILSYHPPGHLSVLIFFVLSGYVIGLTNKQPLTKQSILPYLKKRAIRIYPIYLFCVLLALAIAPTSYSIATIVGNLTTTQVLLVRVIKEIDPIWSLNYEILFYLLFVPVSYFRINPIYVLLFSLVVGTISAYLFPSVDVPLLSSYCFGFTFWLAGLALAQYLRIAKEYTSYAAMLSSLFILMAIEKFNVLSPLLQNASLFLFKSNLVFPATVYWGYTIIRFQDFAFLPYAAIAVVLFSNKEIRFIKPVQAFLFILPAYTYYLIIKHRHEASFAFAPLVLPCVFYMLGLLIYLFSNYFESIARRVIIYLVPLGSISYGLYLVHYPILCTFKQLTYFTGSATSFAVRFFCYLVLSVAMAYLLEKKFQPWLKSRLDLIPQVGQPSGNVVV